MNFFLSNQCPDFGAGEAPEQQASRPPSANSQAGKLLNALKDGELITVQRAIQITGGTEAARRIREVRKYLKANGQYLQDEWVNSHDGSRYKRYWLEA